MDYACVTGAIPDETRSEDLPTHSHGSPAQRFRVARCPSGRSGHALTAALVLTIFGGIFTDVSGHSWSQILASVWAWFAYLVLVATTTGRERRELLICITVATLGELFLGFVWGLYVYRLHNLPLFIPPGHGLVYTVGRRFNRRIATCSRRRNVAVRRCRFTTWLRYTGSALVRRASSLLHRKS
jgi:hypothetical protein